MSGVTPDRPMEGIRTWRNKKGWLVFELHYTADPDKRSSEWKRAAMDSMPDLQSFNREFEIDWTSTTGLPFYPRFYEKYVDERSYFVRPQEIPPVDVPIIRGFDFGFRKPACLWAYQSNDGRFRVLREFSPEGIDVYQFRDAVMVLSGEMEMKDLTHKHDRAITWLERCDPKPPWFKPGTDFINFSGPEATFTYSAPGSEKQEMNDAEVFQGAGIFLSIINQRVSAGTRIIRNLMRHRDQDGPGILVDPSCTTLNQGLAGGLTFGAGTKATPLDDEVAAHPVYSHLHDCLRYMVCGTINVSDKSTVVNAGLSGKDSIQRGDPRAEPPRFGPGEVDDETAFWASIDF